MARPDTSPLQSQLLQSSSLAIVFAQNPDHDAVAAGLSLKLALETTGKKVIAASSRPMTVEHNRLVGVDTITTNFGTRNLVITFPDQTEHVDKVTYNLVQGQLHLVISPKSGSPHIDPSRLKFIPGTSPIDTAFLIGVEKLADLGELYAQSKEILASSRLVSITHRLPQENYAHYQLYDHEASSLSELMAHVLHSLSLPLSGDIATNLLAGLEHATDSFRSHLVSDRTFETAALLKRHGAHRHHDAVSADQFPTGSIPRSTGTAEAEAEVKSAPPDWYAPKVFTGPMLQ